MTILTTIASNFWFHGVETVIKRLAMLTLNFETAAVVADLQRLSGSTTLYHDYRAMDGAAAIALRYDPACHACYLSLMHGFGGARTEAALRNRIDQAAHRFAELFPPGPTYSIDDLLATTARLEQVPRGLLRDIEGLVMDLPLMPGDIPFFTGGVFAFSFGGAAQVFHDSFMGIWQVTGPVFGAQAAQDPRMSHRFRLFDACSTPFPLQSMAGSKKTLLALPLPSWEMIRDACRELLSREPSFQAYLTVDEPGRRITTRDHHVMGKDEIRGLTVTHFEDDGARRQTRVMIGIINGRWTCLRRELTDLGPIIPWLDSTAYQAYLFPGAVWMVRDPATTDPRISSVFFATLVQRAAQALGDNRFSLDFSSLGSEPGANLGRTVVKGMFDQMQVREIDGAKRRVRIRFDDQYYHVSFDPQVQGPSGGWSIESPEQPGFHIVAIPIHAGNKDSLEAELAKIVLAQLLLNPPGKRQSG